MLTRIQKQQTGTYHPFSRHPATPTTILIPHYDRLQYNDVLNCAGILLPKSFEQDSDSQNRLFNRFSGETNQGGFLSYRRKSNKLKNCLFMQK